ncbi:CHAT domain-containing protein [Actinomadura bangladeshensis]|uniref:CHAT domain-containing protein n=1 Tax=Actinomadura bangladeshensis TaxID=453573 RepID=A0A4R4NX98_9ACTN|nr:CHAT domain-containing protein [Actinomadura bangladeshensis]TDC12737.1 CHAT domain-containing protein [Actinomadura bangladeshensis]
MPDAGDDDEAAHLAWAAKFATDTVNTAWLMQRRLGEGIGEQVRDAVIALVVRRGPRAKFSMITERAELRGHEAERLLDHALAVIRMDPRPDPTHIRFFEAHLDMIKLVREGKVDVSAIPVEPVTAQPDDVRPETAAEYDDWARTLRDRGQVEEARAAFLTAIRLARATGDAAVEGSAEIGLFTLVVKTAQATRGSHQRKLEHARRAADAYRRAADRIGERQAVVAAITVLTDIADRTNLANALDRLERLDADYAEWWRTYSTAMNAPTLDEQISGLRQCVDSAHLLGDQADFYGGMCAAKLAFMENRAVPPDADDSVAFQSAVIAHEVTVDGPTEKAAERLEALVLEVEQLRSYARSQSLQRELSDTYQLTYWAAVRCAETLRSPEDAVDLHELGGNRALLAQTEMHQLWKQWRPEVWEDSRPKGLPAFFGRYATAPTERDRSMLMRMFGDQRAALERQERRLLAATPGFTTAAPPMPARSVRALLTEDQRVAVYSATGSIFLLDRAGCRAIGRFPTADLDSVVEKALAHLSDPGNDSPDTRDAVAGLVADIVQPLVDHTPEGCRLFVVPYGPLWRIPLGALAPTMLSRTREVSYVPSLTLLAQMLNRPRIVRLVERFVGFGDPDGSLPHARAEIAHAASTFPDSFTVLGERLHYHLVTANLADADVAHIACHGVFFREFPDFSALHVAGPAGDPEVLWYNELARYELNARLVVLAACHAGTGTTLFGSEYVGFPGAFLAAGARGVLAPLWAVSDASTRMLMQHFYSALSRPLSPAAALREAQQAMAEDPATAHPYHWAGFQLFGVAPAYRIDVAP